MRVDGEIKELVYGMKLDRYKNHSVELVVDRLRVKENDVQRLRSTVEEALKQGGKQMMVIDVDTNQVRHYSQLLMDSENGISYPEPSTPQFLVQFSSRILP